MNLVFSNPGNYKITPGSELDRPIWTGSGAYIKAITHVEICGSSVRYGFRWAENPCLGFGTTPKSCVIQEAPEQDYRSPELYDAIGLAFCQL